MGSSSSKFVKMSQYAETYYKNLSKTNILGDDSSAKEGVQLTLIIKPAESSVDYSISAHLGESTQNYKFLGYTEDSQANVYKNEYVVAFKISFILDYYFEKQQYLLFKIKKGNRVYELKVTLGNVMGSRGQVLTKSLEEGSKEQLVVIGNTLKNNNMNISLYFSALHSVKSPVSLFYVIKKENTKNNQTFYHDVYKSEVKFLKNKLYTPFNFVKIPSGILCNGEYSNPFIIEFHDATHQTILDSVKVTIDKLLSADNELMISDKKNNGTLNVQCKCSLLKEYTFLDYIRGGMQIALVIGIDFTTSNGNPTSPDSLHYINKNNFNSYEKVIRSCGDIVAYYDFDQMFPVYGYGALLPGNQKASMCFNLNFQDDPNINTIDAVLMTYRSTLSKIALNSPTLFAPLIKKVVTDVGYEKNQMIYTILLILTDGIINDMDDTIDALVEASFLPISVIIVGIGKADFTNMEILDSDDQPMFNKNGKKAARDLVQFVPFYKFENDGKKLAEEVLEEIPRQVVDYYKMKNIPPGDPIVI